MNAIRRRLAAVSALSLAITGLAGCSALNPSFVGLLVPDGAVPATTIENARGHVVFIFVNNTEFDPTLVAYLRDQGVDVDDPNLRPRVRFRVRFTFVDDSFLSVEFIDGSEVFQTQVDVGNGSEFVGLLPPDLTQNEKNNAVVLCDVARVEIEQNLVEVFVPVFLKQVRIQPPTDQNPAQTIFQMAFQPQFVPLEVDQVDADGAVTLLRNFGVRDVPAPPENLACGSAVAGILSGTLSVPFISDENGVNNPGFLNTDIQRQAAIPGRYQFRLEVR